MAAKRQTVVGLIVGATLIVAIGVLGLLHATAFDPATVKAELESRIDELNRLPEGEVLRKDALAEELLANESYKLHARALYLKVDRLHPRLHEAAQLERKAQKDVPPFLARCREISAIPKADLPILWGEAKSLLADYGSTRQGDALRQTTERLKQASEAVLRCSTMDVLALNRDVQTPVDEGRFAPAWRKVDDFEKTYLNAGDFAGQLRPLRDSILRKAAKALEKILAEAVSKEQRKKALDRLEGTDFKGLPLPRLEESILGLKRR